MMLGIPYQKSLVIGAIVIIGYTFLGGFLAVSLTDVIQGMLMFFALLIVPVFAIIEMGGIDVIKEGVLNIDPNFLSLTKATGSVGAVPILSIITNLAWGLGYFGQPHILARFMAISDPDELKDSRRIAIVWVAITLVASIICGVIGRLYFVNSPLSDSEQVFMLMANNMFPAVLAGIFLAAILAASMSTADSQLLVTAASISEDIYNQYINKKATDDQKLKVGRFAVILIAGLAVGIAFDPNSSVFGLVSNAWAGLGAAFGPVVLLSVFWKRMNSLGAMAGMVGGAAVVLIWNFLEKTFVSVELFQLYELLPAFIVAFILIVIVSSITKEPSKDMLKTFDEVALATKN
jgi:transporter, SSS family